MSVSVDSGRWGPCCSVEPTGTTRTSAPERARSGEETSASASTAARSGNGVAPDAGLQHELGLLQEADDLAVTDEGVVLLDRAHHGLPVRAHHLRRGVARLEAERLRPD